MLVKDLIEKLPTMNEEEREVQLRHFFDNVSCRLTKGELMNFQNEFDRSKGWEAFKQEQNKIFITCLEMEASEIGAIVREAEGLKPITMDTELNTIIN